MWLVSLISATRKKSFVNGDEKHWFCDMKIDQLSDMRIQSARLQYNRFGNILIRCLYDDYTEDNLWLIVSKSDPAP